ncbi:hypothetical protein L195_g014898 [Trifolium pratense]|uniref:Uncharacterized protein n=1 Tax=Trifolium pratense TaxID=57577 RepID=A0A2K3PS91_TRIPR|nr:hypothetical protein L195_g014898 [Trifolium pratense]
MVCDMNGLRTVKTATPSLNQIKQSINEKSPGVFLGGAVVSIKQGEDLACYMVDRILLSTSAASGLPFNPVSGMGGSLSFWSMVIALSESKVHSHSQLAGGLLGVDLWCSGVIDC